MGTNCCPIGPTDLPSEEDYMYADISEMQLLRLPEFWLLWGLDFILVGCALSWKNHIGTVGLDPTTTTSLVLSWVAVNGASRLLVGWLADALRTSFPRAGWFLVAALVMGFGQLAYVAVPSLGTLWLANLTSAIGYGTFTSAINQVLSIYFGLARYGLNHGFVMTGGAVGGVLFSSVASWIADAAATPFCRADPLPCYRYPVVFSMLFVAVAVGLALVLLRRFPPNWLFYREVEVAESEAADVDMDKHR